MAIIALAFSPMMTLTGATIEDVDVGQHNMTIKTKEGQSWTLMVAHPELLKNHSVQVGDHVSIEVGSNNHVITIAKADESAGGMGHGSGR